MEEEEAAEVRRLQAEIRASCGHLADLEADEARLRQELSDCSQERRPSAASAATAPATSSADAAVNERDANPSPVEVEPNVCASAAPKASAPERCPQSVHRQQRLAELHRLQALKAAVGQQRREAGVVHGDVAEEVCRTLEACGRTPLRAEPFEARELDETVLQHSPPKLDVSATDGLQQDAPAAHALQQTAQPKSPSSIAASTASAALVPPLPAFSDPAALNTELQPPPPPSKPSPPPPPKAPRPSGKGKAPAPPPKAVAKPKPTPKPVMEEPGTEDAAKLVALHWRASCAPKEQDFKVKRDPYFHAFFDFLPKWSEDRVQRIQSHLDKYEAGDREDYVDDLVGIKAAEDAATDAKRSVAALATQRGMSRRATTPLPEPLENESPAGDTEAATTSSSSSSNNPCRGRARRATVFCRSGEDGAEDPGHFEVREMPQELLSEYFKARPWRGSVAEASTSSSSTAPNTTAATAAPRSLIINASHQQLLDILVRKNSILTKASLDETVREIGDALRQCDYNRTPANMLEDILKVIAEHLEGGTETVLDYVAANGRDALQRLQHPQLHQLLLRAAEIPSISSRLQCMKFEATFGDNTSHCLANLDALFAGLRCLEDRLQEMRRFFEVARNFVNVLNKGSSAPISAYGFKLSALPQFAALKCRLPERKDMSLLHFMVLWLPKHDAEALSDAEALRTLELAKTVRTATVFSQCAQLLDGFCAIRKLARTGLYKYKDQEQAIGREGEDDVFHAKMAKFSDRCTPVVRYIWKYAETVFCGYRNFGIYVDDVRAVFPPPKDEQDEKKDIFDVMHELFFNVAKAKQDIAQQGLEAEVNDLLEQLKHAKKTPSSPVSAVKTSDNRLVSSPARSPPPRVPGQNAAAMHTPPPKQDAAPAPEAEDDIRSLSEAGRLADLLLERIDNERRKIDDSRVVSHATPEVAAAGGEQAAAAEATEQAVEAEAIDPASPTVAIPKLPPPLRKPGSRGAGSAKAAARKTVGTAELLAIPEGLPGAGGAGASSPCVTPRAKAVDSAMSPLAVAASPSRRDPALRLSVTQHVDKVSCEVFRGLAGCADVDATAQAAERAAIEAATVARRLDVDGKGGFAGGFAECLDLQGYCEGADQSENMLSEFACLTPLPLQADLHSQIEQEVWRRRVSRGHTPLASPVPPGDHGSLWAASPLHDFPMSPGLDFLHLPAVLQLGAPPARSVAVRAQKGKYSLSPVKEVGETPFKTGKRGNCTSLSDSEGD